MGPVGVAHVGMDAGGDRAGLHRVDPELSGPSSAASPIVIASTAAFAAA